MSAAEAPVDPAESGRPAERRVALPAGPGAVTVGRAFARRALTDWKWMPSTGDHGRHTVAQDVLLIVSELLSNATVHGGGPRELVLTLAHLAESEGGADVLRMTVTDPSPALPAQRTTVQPGVPGGHGLHIIAKLSDRWGAEAREDGKEVWAEISLDRLRADPAR